jgi:hypothetical protein
MMGLTIVKEAPIAAPFLLCYETLMDKVATERLPELKALLKEGKP